MTQEEQQTINAHKRKWAATQVEELIGCGFDRHTATVATDLAIQAWDNAYKALHDTCSLSSELKVRALSKLLTGMLAEAYAETQQEVMTEYILLQALVKGNYDEVVAYIKGEVK